MRATRAFATLLILAVIGSAIFLHTPSLVVEASSSIPLQQEYASGDLQVPYYGGGSLLLWYSWININNTHTIFLAMHSNQYDSPVFTFVGQAYNTTTGQRVFVGNSLVAMEVYNDTDGNGYLDANYSTGTTELKYTLIMNASQTFTPSNIAKTSVDGVPHYRWGVTYGTVQALLINATPPGYGYGGGFPAGDVYIDHVSFFYDFSIVGNTTFLKASYQIGNSTLVPWNGAKVTLQRLSLSLLHATTTVASRPLTVVAGGTPYNSQTNQAPSTFTAAQVNVDNVIAYEFRFRDNYTLLTNPPQTIPALYLASPIDSIPPNALQGPYFDPLLRVQDYVRGQLPDIAGLPSTSNINYTATKFLYRINYPSWSGQAIQHDPTFVAYLGTRPSTPPSIPPGAPAILYVAVATGALALLIAFNGILRKRKTVQPLDQPSDADPDPAIT